MISDGIRRGLLLPQVPVETAGTGRHFSADLPQSWPAAGRVAEVGHHRGLYGRGFGDDDVAELFLTHPIAADSSSETARPIIQQSVQRSLRLHTAARTRSPFAPGLDMGWPTQSADHLRGWHIGTVVFCGNDVSWSAGCLPLRR